MRPAKGVTFPGLILDQTRICFSGRREFFCGALFICVIYTPALKSWNRPRAPFV
jgi:hypothetical protein